MSSHRIEKYLKKITSVNAVSEAFRHKDIYITDHHTIMAKKIFDHFDIGDMARIYGVEPIHFKNNEKPMQISKDMECSIVWDDTGYFICYPKGYLVDIALRCMLPTEKIFHSTINTDEQGKYYYNIWRSR